MTDDPFAKLVRTQEELDNEEKRHLADLLEPYVWVNPAKNTVSFRHDAPNMSPTQRVVAFLLARRVLELINPETIGDVSPRDVEAGTGLPGGTVRPKLLELTEEKILVHIDRTYKISPNFSLSQVKGIFSSDK